MMLRRAPLRLLQQQKHLQLPQAFKLCPSTARAFAKNVKPRKPTSTGATTSSSSPAAAALKNASSKNVGSTGTASAASLRSQPASISQSPETDPAFRAQRPETPEAALSGQNTAPQDTSRPAIDPAEARTEVEDEPQIPFHDLTKGIPSTLDAELEQASRQQSQSETREGEQQEIPVTRPASGGRGDRTMPASSYTTSAERRRNKLMGWTFAGMGLLLLTGPIYLGRNWETEEEERAHPSAPNGWGLGLFYNRLTARMFSTLDYYKEPAFEKLLPDVQPEFKREYTLVLSLEDLLVHSSWSREHGWRLAKRPGVDYFLRYLSPYYEIVIFTSAPSMTAIPITQKLEPFGFVMWRLFREATRYVDGKYVKDLTFLNRDPSKVIMVDTDPSHTSAQPENAIILPKWEGDSKDKDLVALIPFLEYVAALGLEDTRKVLASYQGKDVAAEFAVREAQLREKFKAQNGGERGKRSKSSGLGGFLGGALSSKTGMLPAEGPDAPLDLSKGLSEGRMLLDLIRERGQMQYEAIAKEVRDNEATWRKEMAAEEKKAQEEQMNAMKSGFTGWLGGAKGDSKEG